MLTSYTMDTQGPQAESNELGVIVNSADACNSGTSLLFSGESYV